MPHTPPLPDFTKWPSFPFEGEFRVKDLDPPVAVEPPRKGEGTAACISCNAPDDAYIWISERWRVRAMDRPTGLPMVLILESRSHLDLGDLPNLLAAELGVMTVRLERAVRSLDGVARVHVNRWGDGSAHLHMWFLARPYGRLQLRGTFLSLWDDILPAIPESQWRENLALIAAWLAEFGGRPLAEPPRIQWQAPSNLSQQASAAAALVEATAESVDGPSVPGQEGDGPAEPADTTSVERVGPPDVAGRGDGDPDGDTGTVSGDGGTGDGDTGTVSGDGGTGDGDGDGLTVDGTAPAGDSASSTGSAGATGAGGAVAEQLSDAAAADDPVPGGPSREDAGGPAAEGASGVTPGNGAVRAGIVTVAERDPAHSPEQTTSAGTTSAGNASGDSSGRPAD